MSEEIRTPSIDEQFEAHATDIGRVATMWASLELMIDKTIWELASIDDAAGMCLTSQVVSIHGRMRSLISLMKLRNVPAAIIKDANTLSSEASKTVLRRNQIVHSPLIVVDGSDTLRKIYISADKILKVDISPVDQSYIVDTVKYINEHTQKFLNIRENVLSFLSSSPEKSPP